MKNDYLKNIINFFNTNDNDNLLHSPDEILMHLCSMIKRTSPVDMERQIHDIIIKNIEYDDSGKKIDHDALGPLVYKKGVCDGISKLAKLIFDQIGIPSKVVTGTLHCTGDSPGPHAWNVVYIDGYWYHLDITADLGLSGDKKSIRYDYFNLSDSEISTDHTLDRHIINCTKSNNDYYSMNGLFINNVHQFEKLIGQSLLKKNCTVTVKLPRGMDPNLTQMKLLDVVEHMCKKNSFKGYNIAYSMNPDQMIYSFTISLF